MKDSTSQKETKPRISFSWNIHFKCNYRCPYCWFHGEWQDFSKHNHYFSLEDIVKAWKGIYDRYGSVHVDVLGGEPFHYPNFVEIIQELSNYHTFNISTNLSFAVEKVIGKLDPARVKILPSFHPSFSDLDSFLKKLLILKDNGFGQGASLLAYPPHLRLWEYYKGRFEAASVSLGLTPFWGKHENVDYPQGYTEEERNIIRPYLGSREGELFQVEPKKIKKGSLCRAGQIYGVVKSNGQVKRCGMDAFDNSLGNIFDGTFKLLDKPSACHAEYCPCNEWAFLLIEDVKEESKVDKEAKISVRVREKTTTTTSSSKELSPKFPRKDPPYRVYWNWEITHKCNYRCSYCYFWKTESDVSRYIEAGRWKEIWDEVFFKYGCCHLRLSGGEPSIYPNFLNLIAALSQKHTIDITTNLSLNINYLIEKVNPVALFISPSFHPEFDTIDDFIKKILILRENHFRVTGIAYVAYPPNLPMMGDFMKTAEKENIEFKIIPFCGEFEGRKFPDGYDNEERALIKEMAEHSNSRALNMRWTQWHISKEDCSDNKAKPGRGSASFCRMGQMYAKVFPDGRVTRCCLSVSEVLGNISDENFRLLDEPKICNTVEKCPCFKAMFVGEEESWSTYWETPEHPIYKNKK